MPGIGTREERCLKTASDCADVMCHMLVPATANAICQLYRVESVVLLDDERQKTATIVLMSCVRHG